MTLKILQMFIYFIKEAIFSNKEESDFRNPRFNPRKYVLLTTLVGLLITNYILYFTAHKVHRDNMKLKKDNSTLVEIRKNLTSCDKDIEKYRTELIDANTYIMEKQLTIDKLRQKCGKFCEDIR